MNTNRIWIGGAVVISVVALVAGWFLGIAPQLAEAAKSATRTVEINASNDVHEAELAAMKKQYGEVDATAAQLAELRVALPPTAAYAEFVRSVYSAASANAVTVTNFTASAAIRYSPIAGIPAVTDDSTDAEAEPEAVASIAASATPGTLTTSPLVTPENFIVIPVSIQVDGGFDSFRTFTASLQAGGRLFLVTGLTAVADPVAAAPAKGAAASSTVYHGTITGNIYVLADPTLDKTVSTETSDTSDATDPAETPAVTPTATPTP